MFVMATMTKHYKSVRTALRVGEPLLKHNESLSLPNTLENSKSKKNKKINKNKHTIKYN